MRSREKTREVLAITAPEPNCRLSETEVRADGIRWSGDIAPGSIAPRLGHWNKSEAERSRKLFSAPEYGYGEAQPHLSRCATSAPIRSDPCTAFPQVGRLLPRGALARESTDRMRTRGSIGGTCSLSTSPASAACSRPAFRSIGTPRVRITGFQFLKVLFDAASMHVKQQMRPASAGQDDLSAEATMRGRAP